MPPLTLDVWPVSTVAGRLDDLASVYSEVYAEPPYNAGPLWSAESFIERTRRQTERDGFSFVAANDDEGVTVGFAFGLTFPEGTWWSGDATTPPVEILRARKIAVIELVVRRPWRRMGVGRELMDRLLADRDEQYAILTAVPDTPAREIYRRWGWMKTGTAHHTPDAPIMDALALRLPAGNAD